MYKKFQAPVWCSLKYTGIKDAIFGAAEIVGAKLYMSASFIFRLDDFEKVEAYFKKHGKEEIVKVIVDFVKGKGNIVPKSVSAQPYYEPDAHIGEIHEANAAEEEKD